MDEYIAFCEGALLGEKSEGLLNAVFPLQLEGVRAERQRKRGQRRWLLCGEEQHSLFAGEEYKTWDEVGGEEYEIVMERGSRLLGVGAEYLNGIVRTMDKQR